MFGTIFLLIGVFLLLNNFNLIGINFWSSIAVFWPIGLILGGVCLLLRQRVMALLFVMFTISLLVVSSVEVGSGNYLTKPDKFVKLVDFSGDEKSVDFNLEFGAGTFDLKGSEDLEVLAKFDIESYLPNEVNKLVTFKSKDNVSKIKFSRNEAFENGKVLSVFNLDKKNVYVDSVLNSKFPMDLDLSFGAAEINLDLRELMVDNLDMDFGASGTTIKFANYPTKVDINTGASDMVFKFVKDYPVLVQVDGGLVSVDLDGFTKVGSTYKSENFKYDEEYIVINVDAGASSISGRFVE